MCCSSLDSILGELGVPTEAGKQPWPRSIQEYAAIFDTHFERIIDYVRAHGVEVSRVAETRLAASSFMALCPHCECESNEFTLEGSPRRSTTA
jgi:hypothetical protein